MNHDSFPSLGSLQAGDRALRELCERLRGLATAMPAAAVDGEIERQVRLLLAEIEAKMSAHHQDEETQLFPALLEAVAGSDPVCLRELTEALTAEHRALEAQWRMLRQAAAPERDALCAFAVACLRHIQREEEELFPMAGRLL